MNRKTWDDDNLLDGEIIRCNTCGWEEVYSMHIDNSHKHDCRDCGWEIFQTDESLTHSGVESNSAISQYSHKGCNN